MSATNGDFLRQYSVLSTTVEVTVGSEPDLYLAVDLSGAPAADARGVVSNSREGLITVVLLGQVPVKVANGETIAIGDPVAANADGELIAQTAATDSLGIALDAVTTASGEYIEVFVNPRPYVAAT